MGLAQEDEKAVSAVVNGEVQLVYISPENLLCIGTSFLREEQAKFTSLSC